MKRILGKTAAEWTRTAQQIERDATKADQLFPATAQQMRQSAAAARNAAERAR